MPIVHILFILLSQENRCIFILVSYYFIIFGLAKICSKVVFGYINLIIASNYLFLLCSIHFCKKCAILLRKFLFFMPAIGCEPFVVTVNTPTETVISHAGAVTILPIHVLEWWNSLMTEQRVLYKQLAGRGIATLRDSTLLARYTGLELRKRQFNETVARQYSHVRELWFQYQQRTRSDLDLAFVVSTLEADLSSDSLNALHALAATTRDRKGKVWAFITAQAVAATTRTSIAQLACGQRCFVGDTEYLSTTWGDFMSGNTIRPSLSYSFK